MTGVAEGVASAAPARRDLATGTGRLETRATGANFRIEYQNGDNLNVDYDHSYELLEAPFRIAPGVIIPVGGPSVI